MVDYSDDLLVIARALEYNTTVTSLDLMYEAGDYLLRFGIGDSAVLALCRVFERNNTITTVHLGTSPFLDRTRGMQLILRSLEMNQSVSCRCGTSSRRDMRTKTWWTFPSSIESVVFFTQIPISRRSPWVPMP